MSNDYDTLINQHFNPRAKAIGALGSAPDQAAKSIDLSNKLGIPFDVTHADQNGAAQDAKIKSVVEDTSHPAVASYINEYPPAAHVSNDDYAQLGKIADFPRNTRGLIGVPSHFVEVMSNPNSRAQLWEAVKKYPEHFATGMKELIEGATTMRAPETYDPSVMDQLAEKNIETAFGAGLFGISGGRAPFRQGRGFDFGPDITPKTTAEFLDQVGSATRGTQWRAEINEFLRQKEAGQAPKEGEVQKSTDAPYSPPSPSTQIALRNGQEPKIGTDPVADSMHVAQAHTSASALDALVAEAEQSKTAQRSPEAFEQFLSHVTNDTISIPAEKLAEIYQKDPEATSWIPDIIDKLDEGLRTGGDVEIPLASYLARGRDLHEQVRDDVRTSVEGLTVNEAKDLEAYHGSPHEFDAFDMSRIGSGEGAQSYGHGLYFAENIETAKSYRDALVDSRVDGKPYNPENPNHYAAGLLAEFKTKEAAIAEVERRKTNDPTDSFLERVARRLQRPEELPKIEEKSNLYKVRILADKDHMLDWDKPLGEQSAHVQNALLNHPDPSTAGTAAKYGEMGGRELLQRIEANIRRTAAEAGNPIEPAESYKMASRFLSEAGIPGIKYLDQGSRVIEAPDKIVSRLEDIGARLREIEALPETARTKPIHDEAEKLLGEGDELKAELKQHREANSTRNFVVFDDKHIQIIEKNGEPVQNAVRAVAQAEEAASGLRPLFQDSAAAGMTKDQFNRYSKKVAQQIAEIEEAAIKAAKVEIARRQTAEWKKNEADIKNEVIEEFKDRPDFAADKFFKDKKIDFARMNDIDKDLVATSFGFDSGKAMTDALVDLEAARKDLGLNPGEYLKSAIDAETLNRMESKYGDLDSNILMEARDVALADTHSDIMAMELRALTEQAGLNPPLSKADMQEAVRQNFGAADIKSASKTAKWQRQALKAGREAEVALLKGDFVKAAKAKQRQLLSFMYAQEAAQLQKEMAKANKLFKQFSDREVGGVDQAFTDRVHEILAKVGMPVKRPVGELSDIVSKQSLEDFVTEKQGFSEMPVADFLQDPGFKASLETLSTDEFRALHDSVRTLAKHGREAQKVYSAQGKAEIAEVVQRAVDSLSRFNPVHQPLNPKMRDRVNSVGRWIMAAHILPERVFDYTDSFDPNGPFNSYVDRPLRDSYNRELELNEKVVKQLQALKPGKDVDLQALIPNDLIRDPNDRTGFMGLNRNNLRHIMLNTGNRGKRSNLEKLLNGFEIEEKPLFDWINKHATKEDWDWVQGMWDIMEDLKQESDSMYARLSGVAPTRIPAHPVNTPFGQKKGGYIPLIYDPQRSNIQSDITRSVLEEPGYFKATTPNSYAKERTGYQGALDISGVTLDGKIRQVVHDIAFREAIINAQKVLGNKDIQAGLTKYWGKQYTDLMLPWLKDIANIHNSDDTFAIGAQKFSVTMRQNVISTLTAFNPGTVAKHGLTALAMSVEEVGARNFLQAMKDLGGTSYRADSQWQFVLENSPLMRNRMLAHANTIQGAYRIASGKGLDLPALRHMFMEAGRYPIAFFDALSAMPTWLAGYNRAIAEGVAHEDAVFRADKAATRAHGSSATMDKPRVLRTDEGLKWFTGLYNFFNHNMNKITTLAWDTKSAVTKAIQGEQRGPRETASSIASRFVYLIVIPALVEEWVTSWFDDSEKKRGYGARIAGSVVRELGGGFVGLRELTHSFTTGGPGGQLHEPSTGMLSTITKDVTRALDDVRSKLQKGHPSNAWISHALTSVGYATGMMGSSPGKAIQFGEKVLTGQESPKTPYQVLKGMRKGTIIERRRH